MILLQVCSFCSDCEVTMAIEKKAERRGCKQVLWLNEPDDQIKEVGDMSLFINWLNEKGGK